MLRALVFGGATLGSALGTTGAGALCFPPGPRTFVTGVPVIVLAKVVGIADAPAGGRVATVSVVRAYKGRVSPVEDVALPAEDAADGTGLPLGPGLRLLRLRRGPDGGLRTDGCLSAGGPLDAPPEPPAIDRSRIEAGWQGLDPVAVLRYVDGVVADPASDPAAVADALRLVDDRERLDALGATAR
jgi:hypothetical protein